MLLDVVASAEAEVIVAICDFTEESEVKLVEEVGEGEDATIVANPGGACDSSQDNCMRINSEKHTVEYDSSSMSAIELMGHR